MKEQKKIREGSSSSFDDTKKKVLASTQPSIILSCVVETMQAVLSTIGKLSLFEIMQLFIAHLEVEYKGLKCCHRQHIQEYQQEKTNASCTL